MHGSLETLAVEVDLCAPGWQKIIDPSPPVDIIARDIIFGMVRSLLWQMFKHIEGNQTGDTDTRGFRSPS